MTEETHKMEGALKIPARQPNICFGRVSLRNLPGSRPQKKGYQTMSWRKRCLCNRGCCLQDKTRKSRESPSAGFSLQAWRRK